MSQISNLFQNKTFQALIITLGVAIELAVYWEDIFIDLISVVIFLIFALVAAVMHLPNTVSVFISEMPFLQILIALFTIGLIELFIAFICKLQHKEWLGLTALGTLVFLSLTYGRFEFQTALFGATLSKAYDKSCWITMSGSQLKVMSYGPYNAKLFVKEKTGSTYIVRYQRAENQQWSMNARGVCNEGVMYSAGGGSADNFFYWY